jgi:2-hydroxy-3-oxopropionate reductase
MADDPVQNRSRTVGFLGLGVMGAPMARNALAGAEGDGRVVLAARSPARAAALVEAGAVLLPTARDVADAASVVVLMVPDLPEVEQLLEGPDGLLAGSAPVVLAVGSTVSAVGVRRLATRVEERTGGRVSMIDCPVSGGEEGAVQGTLAIMVGGDEAPVAAALPFLRLLGRPVHLGAIGAGAVAEACNQMIVAATVLALGEATVLAERSGLEVAALLDLLQGGYAASRVLDTRKSRFVDHDYSPSGAARYLKKDLGFALEIAAATGTRAAQLPALAAAFDELVAAGYGDDDIAATQPFIAGRAATGAAGSLG